MSILQRYIFKEWLWTFLAVALVLLIVLVGVFLGDMFNDIADGRMPPGLVGMQLLLYLPEALGNILPLAGFVAIMWGLGRLYRDQEMAVMRASGFPWQQLLRPLFALTIPVAVFLLVLKLAVGPVASAASSRALEEAFRSAAVWGLQPGQFHVLQQGELVIYVEAIEDEGRTLRNIFMYQLRDGTEQIWIAERGEYWVDPDSRGRFLTLENGQITEGVRDQLDIRSVRFGRNDLLLPEPEIEPPETSQAGLSSLMLLQDLGTPALAELQWRLTPALLLMVLGFLAIPLAHSDPREGRGSRVVLGILTYTLYANLLFLCRSWVADGLLPATLGMWWIHVLVLGIGLIWLHRQERLPRRRRARRGATASP
ncbi:MAG: LPS export ABC transporter permease LptF [Xanthomonadales bacterium]|nr:LPS export ABC transporter permease LptF [Xanthomonadales bacterium]NIN59580.1 LPS export ABC transporter permease LptF [Xanthomonadales bacterium]NIN74967.1 LPS export ABC transporter permease LptF [Xanthomonadales bacterium]NIO12667.1 LPS export ABC transporter permease LptF [Xanthomonadales bacterium]NIP11973.1 LPS export ABC transporter permease LptF [Xanthomonadales bacterium]